MERSKAEKAFLELFGADGEDVERKDFMKAMQRQMAKDEQKMGELLFESLSNLHSVLNHVSTMRLKKENGVACFFCEKLKCGRFCKVRQKTFSREDLKELEDERFVVPSRENDAGLFGSRLEIAAYLKQNKNVPEFKLYEATFKGEHAGGCNYQEMLFPWAESSESES